MLDFLRKEKGSVSIEATISLSAFMFAIVTILTIINIATIQAKMQVAIDTTANEVSQYSYLYGLTGFNKSQQAVYDGSKDARNNIDGVMSNVNTVFNEIEKLGNTGESTNINNPLDIANAWGNIAGSADKIGSAGSALEQQITDMAKNPKELIFGLAKLAASDGLDLAKSRLIAAPISKAMVQKHLINTKDGQVEQYLKDMNVVPAANGKYLDGLDFTRSSLFVHGSNEIRIVVTYKVKIIPLLPIKTEYTFTQTAVTNGWLGGESTYKGSAAYIANDTLWTKATVTERADYIRHMVLEELQAKNYNKTSGLTDVQAYSKDKNEFVMISSMNPLYSADGETPKTVNDVDKAAIINSVEQLCGKIRSTTDGLNSVTTTKVDENGDLIKTDNKCTGASNRVILVIPDDQGLKEKIESYIKEAKTNGVIIEVQSSYGKGANGQYESQTKGE